MLANVNVKKRFEDMLGSKSAGFMSSIMSLTTANKQLQTCDPKTILSAAGIAATLDLPINPNLGFAYVIPYGKEAQFQMGYKGFIQLAMRSGQYKLMNASEVYEGELVTRNRITGEFTFDFEAKVSDKIIGYCAYIQLVNGFEKYLYMTVEDVEKHAKKYSQTYKSAKEYIREKSKWTTDFNAMALKTVIKLLISKYGILSIDMQTAIQADQAVIHENENGDVDFDYTDNHTIDAEFETANGRGVPDLKLSNEQSPFDVKDGEK
jgi:recombination protein RecT